MLANLHGKIRDYIDADDMYKLIVMTSSFTMDAKRNSACIDTAYVMDGSGVSPDNTDHLTTVPPSTKRFKLITGERLPLPDDPKTASGVTKLPNSQDRYASRESPRGTDLRTETPKDRQGLPGPQTVSAEQRSCSSS